MSKKLPMVLRNNNSCWYRMPNLPHRKTVVRPFCNVVLTSFLPRVIIDVIWHFSPHEDIMKETRRLPTVVSAFVVACDGIAMGPRCGRSQEFEALLGCTHGDHIQGLPDLSHQSVLHFRTETFVSFYLQLKTISVNFLRNGILWGCVNQDKGSSSFVTLDTA